MRHLDVFLKCDASTNRCEISAARWRTIECDKSNPLRLNHFVQHSDSKQYWKPAYRGHDGMPTQPQWLRLRRPLSPLSPLPWKGKRVSLSVPSCVKAGDEKAQVGLEAMEDVGAPVAEALFLPLLPIELLVVYVSVDVGLVWSTFSIRYKCLRNGYTICVP